MILLMIFQITGYLLKDTTGTSLRMRGKYYAASAPFYLMVQ